MNNNDLGRNENTKMSEMAPGFHPMTPDIRLTSQPTTINTNEQKIDPKVGITLSNLENAVKTNLIKPTILSTCFIITHVCLGNFTIFSFAQKTKSFGLVWMIVFCILIAIISYWVIMRSFAASIKCKDTNYSKITEEFLGNKGRKLLNTLILIYAFIYMMYLIGLTFPMTGRINYFI